VVTQRPSWHDVRLAMAGEIAKRSLCARDQVGAIVVDASNKVIGEGYNGPPRGFRHENKLCTAWCQRTKNAKIEGEFAVLNPQGEVVKYLGLHPTYDDCPSLHAEANALLLADRALCVGGTIFVTSYVCFSCAKLVANSGLTSVVVRSTVREHRPVAATLDFLAACGVDVTIYEEEE